MPSYRAGLLLIRAWIEKGSRKPLRAHIRATTDVSKGFETELTVADVASTSSAVETWLEKVEADGQFPEEGDAVAAFEGVGDDSVSIAAHWISNPFGVLGDNLLARVEGTDVLEYDFGWSNGKVTLSLSGVVHSCDSPNIYVLGAALHCENPAHGDVAIKGGFGKPSRISSTTTNP